MPFLPWWVPETGREPGIHQVASSASAALTESRLPLERASTKPNTTFLFSATPIGHLLCIVVSAHRVSKRLAGNRLRAIVTASFLTGAVNHAQLLHATARLPSQRSRCSE